jgi:hypothetical protein
MRGRQETFTQPLPPVAGQPPALGAVMPDAPAMKSSDASPNARSDGWASSLSPWLGDSRRHGPNTAWSSRWTKASMRRPDFPV